MKYTNTSRTLSLVFHAIIFLAFGALGIYFGLIVAPCYFSNATDITTIEAPYNLYSELGFLGLTLATISGYGFVQAYKSVKDSHNDVPVVKAFNAFICEGYITAIFCFLNAVLYFDAIRGGSSKGLGFLIVLMLLLCIGIMIATNIPMVKLYDNKDQTPLLTSLGMSAGVFFGWAAIVTLGTLIGSWSIGVVYWSYVINSQLISFLVVYVINAFLLIYSSILLKKGGEKGVKLAGYFTGLAGFLVSLCYIADGIIGLVYGENSDSKMAVHLEGINHAVPKSGDAYAIICLVIGALLLIGAVVFVGLHANGKLTKKKEK